MRFHPVFLAPMLGVLLAACGNSHERMIEQTKILEVCRTAVENGWDSSNLGNPIQTCEAKLGEVHNLVMPSTIEGEIRPCIHGGTPRFCWNEKGTGVLRIWWSNMTQYGVHPDDRARVEEHIDWL